MSISIRRLKELNSELQMAQCRSESKAKAAGQDDAHMMNTLNTLRADHEAV